MTWDEVQAFLLQFPDTVASTSWNMPGVKTGGRLVAWWRDQPDSPESLAFKVDPAELEALVEDPGLPYYTIEHFRKHGARAVLVRPADVGEAELREMLTDAWLLMAKPTVRAAWLERNEQS